MMITNTTDSVFTFDSQTDTTTSNTFKIWMDEYKTEYPIYTDGTKLLRDYAERSNEYIEKKAISQQGWKSRYELRKL